MKYLPLMHSFTGKSCLVIGGGKVALRRAERVIEAGGLVDVVAQECLPKLKLLVEQCRGELSCKLFNVEDIEKKYGLVIAATNDQKINYLIARECKKKTIMVNVVDDEALCDVVFPTIVNREPAVIAISSGSASPQFSMLLKDRINMFLPSGYGKLASLFGKYRDEVKEKVANERERKYFWNKVVYSHIAEGAMSGNYAHAEAQLKSAIDDHENFSAMGEVYLIGAGPGDPDLLTMRAFRLLQQAEVIVYDRLVSPEILERLEHGKELVYVGKERSLHCVPQQEINELLVGYAEQGKIVARLKGGDPFVFGRGGEEIEKLAARNIPFQVIPGITAANGCASYAGIPLTHRDHAQSVRLVTGQLQNGTVDLDWPSLVALDQTIVFYMGLQGLPVICSKLIEHGSPEDTLVAVIEKGTTLDQKVYTCTLATLPKLLEENKIMAPTLTIVGSVVSLHKSLGRNLAR